MEKIASLFISTYNQENFISDAISGCAPQICEGVELIISDDKSTDKTATKILNHPACTTNNKSIKINFNQENIGLIKHINLSIALCAGDLIINCAGDDISLPNRATEIISAYEKSKKSAMLIHSKAIEMSPEGVDERICGAPMVDRKFTLEDLARKFTAYQGCTGAWNRKIFDIFGPIYFTETYEDVILAFRAALLDAIVYIDKPLVRYRVRVGISFTKESEKYRYRLLRERDKKQLSMAINTLKQRLRDIDCITPRMETERIKKLMNKDLIKYEARKTLQDEGVIALLKSKNNLPMAFVTITSEFFRVINILSKTITYRVKAV